MGTRAECDGRVALRLRLPACGDGIRPRRAVVVVVRSGGRRAVVGVDREVMPIRQRPDGQPVLNGDAGHADDDVRRADLLRRIGRAVGVGFVPLAARHDHPIPRRLVHIGRARLGCRHLSRAGTAKWRRSQPRSGEHRRQSLYEDFLTSPFHFADHSFMHIFSRKTKSPLTARPFRSRRPRSHVYRMFKFFAFPP